MTTANTQFGRYTIVGTLGRGGFADVFRAWDPGLNREVALKALLPFHTGNPDIRRRFIDEARALASLQHSNIVQVYDVGEEGGRPFFTMELIRGQTLSDALRTGRRPEFGQVVRIVQALASALDEVHQHGLVHRDIKPANIMLDNNGRVVLMDFGIARSLNATQQTVTGAIMGTLTYMAPEQVLGQPAGPAADIYALGILTYHLLAGQPPFQGDTARVLHAQAYEAPPPLQQLRPGLPAYVYAAISAALEKDPSRRPPSASAFATTLAGQATPPLEPTVVADPPPRKVEPRSTLWRYVLAGVGTGAVVLVLATVSVVAIRNNGSSPKTPTPSGPVASLTAPAATVAAPAGAPSSAPNSASSPASTAAAGSNPSATPATLPASATAAVTVAPAPVYSDFQARNAAAWSQGQANLEGCFHFERGAPGSIVRLRVAPRGQTGTPIVDDATLALTASAGDPCIEIPARGPIPAGDYLALLYDQNWRQLASYQFTVQPAVTVTPPDPTPVRPVTPASPALPPAPESSGSRTAVYIESVQASGPAVRGQGFSFTVVARNVGLAGGQGSLSVSSPDQRDLHLSNINCGGGKDGSMTPGNRISRFSVAGDGTASIAGTITSNDPLAEVDFSGLTANGSCAMTVNVGQLAGSTATFWIRVTVFSADGHTITTWPLPGSVRDLDQQGLPAVTWSVPLGP